LSPEGLRSPVKLTFPLSGPAGEPVDLARTIRSHGLASLPPLRHDEAGSVLEATVPTGGAAIAAARTVRIREGEPGVGVVEVVGPPVGREEGEELLAAVRRVLALDDDLSPFYALASGDPELSWAAGGAGRMVRGSSIFEDVVKTVCTTNCSWSATTRMISALVEHLGVRAPASPKTGPLGRAFPTAIAMAEAGEDFYRDAVRAGYRGPYLLSLARSVAEGVLDLEALAAPAEELPDDELYRRLLLLPGVGPYAAAHIMMLLGRHSRLILDSWTRPTYARLIGKEAVPDGEIKARFAPYGPYAGLAFWLYLTESWVPSSDTAL
jgi:N-glycosylase/DNA lyase